MGYVWVTITTWCVYPMGNSLLQEGGLHKTCRSLSRSDNHGSVSFMSSHGFTAFHLNTLVNISESLLMFDIIYGLNFNLLFQCRIMFFLFV